MSDSTDDLTMEYSMEEAIDMLQHTLCLARISQQKPIRYSAELLHHAQALKEDLTTLASTSTKSQQTLDLAKSTKRDALMLTRSLERDAIPLQLQETAAATPLPDATPATVTASAAKKKIKLRSLQVPTFSGNAAEFKLFIDTYNENVEHNPDLTDTAKWLHLNESLAGPAAELISKVPRRPETRPIALSMLTTKYGSTARTICEIYSQLNALPTASIDENSLRYTQTQIEGLLLSLESMGHEVNGNEFMRSVVKGKFPKEIIHLVVPTPEKDNLKDIRSNLHTIITAREGAISDIIYTQPIAGPFHSSTTQSKPQTRTMRTTPNTRIVRCVFCGDPHWLDECKKYATITDRQQRIQDRCFKCFRTKHAGNCATDRKCIYCNSADHNRALCPTKFPLGAALYTHTTQPSTPVSTTNDGVYLTFLLTVSSDHNDTPQEIRAVIDSGGVKSILTSTLANQLNIQPTETRALPLSGLGKATLPSIVPASDTLYLHTPFDGKISLSTYVAPDIADDLPAANTELFRAQYPQHAEYEIPLTGAGRQVDLLLGKDCLAAICALHKSIYVSSEHQLMGTKFGYLIVGQQLNKPTPPPATHLFTFHNTHNELKNLWDLETLGLHEIEKDDIAQEQQALEKFHANISFVDGKYQVGWPFITFPPMLNDNYTLALGRLRSLWNKIRHDYNLLMAYHETIQSQNLAGITEDVPAQEPNKSYAPHYIPHHPIIRAEKSTKIRIVYDASARLRKQDKSLNDNLHPGTNWVKNLVVILLRSRRFKNLLTGDIEKAFLQIRIRPQDRDFVRFLWLHDPLLPPTPENVRIMRFCRMAFGIVSAPFLLAATILYHLKNHPHDLNQIIQDGLYADNLIVSLPPDIEPISFYTETKNIFNDIGMNMTQWGSNNNELNQAIPLTDQEPKQIQSLLGLQWHKKEDTLQLNSPSFTAVSDNLTTKRKALQQFAAIFDPFGLAIPILLPAKLFIRKLWKLGCSWDEGLDDSHRNEWAKIVYNLQQTKNIKISRELFPNIEYAHIEQFQLHVFADASAEAYAVVAYARVVTQNSAHTTFIAAKNRLTPQKQLSIPRLELLALLMGSRFATFLCDAIQWPQKIQTYLWSDSRCALAWIDSSKILPAIIQRQVKEIHAATLHSIRHVPTELNYADVATRGASYEDLKAMGWWKGPNWLRHETNWPPHTTQEPGTTEQIHKENILLLTHQPKNNAIRPETFTGVMNIDYAAYSSFHKLARVVAYCCQAINSIVKRKLLKTETNIDTLHAELLIIRFEQLQAYAPVFHAVKPPSKLRNLRIFLDDNHLIRCNTRLTASTLAADTISPILLARKSRLTTLLVLQAHKTCNHGGTTQTLAKLRSRFWLPQGRREVYNIIRTQCFSCRRFYARPFIPPPPAPLPEFRVQQGEKPFDAVGIDIFGPFYVRNNPTVKTKTKNWVLLHTCTTTRAMHLEIITDMTTQEILNALRRFIARRGAPKIILSDNAPQFVALDNKFSDLWKTINIEPQAIKYFTENRIQWKFITPESPWMGGFYERLVKSVKNSLERTYGERVLTARQFETSIVEIEGILNARPLLYIDTQPETHILSPQDFLNVKHTAIPLPDATDNPSDRLMHLWQSSQKSLQYFWKIWSQQYLVYLRDRDDKLRGRRGDTITLPQPGDLVLLVDADCRRSSWKMGKVETLIVSQDGHTRSALIYLGDNRRVIRPIIKLAPLDIRVADCTETKLTPDRRAIIIEHQAEPPTDAEPTSDAEEIEIQLDCDW